MTALDPGSWLDRAAHARRPGRREALVAVARALERFGLWQQVHALFRRVQADHVALRSVWNDAPVMARREVLLHALRLGAIQQIWLIGTGIPDFSPRHGITRQDFDVALLRLQIPAAMDLLSEIFPIAADPATEQDFGEPPGPRVAGSYIREQHDIVEPLRALFGVVREVATAITHEVGAFG